MLAAPPRLGRVRVVAVDGPSGAGKSTLAGLLVAELRHRGHRVALISTDHFATWDDPVSWWPRLAEGVLDPLGRGETGAYRKLDWTTGVPEPGELVSVAPPEVLVLEGVSSGRRSFRASLSVLCWVPGPAEPARLERAVQRDGEASRERLHEWQTFERGWFAVDLPATDLTPNGLVLSAQNGHEIDVP
ncbi:uridine kinase [Amycolatopsis rhizosphaerae]|uniref:Uridine kinase n=1 Tax=Amycolatopsis rhizosphaerae TaxID=2053003 RepID=A0A558CFW9_9PSEU|nr:uridine kinase [Amycolatopsis rhizosphaerae]